MVWLDGQIQFIFDTSGTSETNRTSLGWSGTNALVCRVFGSDGGSISDAMPITVQDGERLLLDYAMSYDSDTLRLFLRSGEEQFLLSAAHQINSTDLQDIYLGASSGSSLHSSTRFLVPWAKTDQVLTTESEFEQLFEVIS